MTAEGRALRSAPLFVILLGAASSAAAACTPALNFPNGDLPHFPLALPPSSTTSDDALCASMCAAEPLCVLYTLLPAGCDADARGAPVCYLKGSRQPQTQQNCTCSALVSRTAYPAPAGGPATFSVA